MACIILISERSSNQFVLEDHTNDDQANLSNTLGIPKIIIENRTMESFKSQSESQNNLSDDISDIHIHIQSSGSDLHDINNPSLTSVSQAPITSLVTPEMSSINNYNLTSITNNQVCVLDDDPEIYGNRKRKELGLTLQSLPNREEYLGSYIELQELIKGQIEFEEMGRSKRKEMHSLRELSNRGLEEFMTGVHARVSERSISKNSRTLRRDRSGKSNFGLISDNSDAGMMAINLTNEKGENIPKMSPHQIEMYKTLYAEIVRIEQGEDPDSLTKALVPMDIKEAQVIMNESFQVESDEKYKDEHPNMDTTSKRQTRVNPFMMPKMSGMSNYSGMSGRQATRAFAVTEKPVSKFKKNYTVYDEKGLIKMKTKRSHFHPESLSIRGKRRSSTLGTPIGKCWHVLPKLARIFNK